MSYSKAYIDAPYYYRKSNVFLTAFAGIKSSTALLDPETMHSYQLTFGATQWIRGLDLEANAFYNRAWNIISMNLLDYNNSGRSDIYGLELSGRYERPRFSVHLAASWQGSRNYTTQQHETGHFLNTPALAANAVATWRASRHLRLHARMGYFSRQYTEYIDITNYVRFMQFTKALVELTQKYEDQIDSGDLSALPPEDLAALERITDELTQISIYADRDISPYLLIDVGANYTWGQLELGLNVHNLFDREYSISGANTGLIPQKGRWLMFDIAYKF